MRGLTGLGGGFPSVFGNSSGSYSRDNFGGASFSPIRNHFPKSPMQFLPEDENDNLPDISERLNAINRESSLPFARQDNFQNLFMRRNENDFPSGRLSFPQDPLSSSEFMSRNEPLSNSFNNNNISFKTSIFGNDAMQFINTLKNIIDSPQEYQRHKENGTLPTDKDLKNIEENMLGKLQKLTAEKTGTVPSSDNVLGGIKDMFQQNMQRKNSEIQKLIGQDRINSSSQDVDSLQDALKNISRL